MTNRSLCFSFFGIMVLSACGGGGGGGATEIVYVQLLDTTSTATSALVGHDLESVSATEISGSLDRASGRAAVDGQSGDVDPSRTNINLDSGGSITLNPGSTDFVATFVNQPLSGTPSVGVIGVGTDIDDLPTSGTVMMYSGSNGSAIQIIDGGAVYDLTGSTTANVLFGSGEVDLTFSDLGGTRTSGTSTPVGVTDVAIITIDDAQISGASFSGGTATFSSTEIGSTLSSSEVVSSSGGFFGPDADEIGGVFIIDDQTGGSLLIQGTFLAD